MKRDKRRAKVQDPDRVNRIEWRQSDWSDLPSSGPPLHFLYVAHRLESIRHRSGDWTSTVLLVRPGLYHPVDVVDIAFRFCSSSSAAAASFHFLLALAEWPSSLVPPFVPLRPPPPPSGDLQSAGQRQSLLFNATCRHIHQRNDSIRAADKKRFELLYAPQHKNWVIQQRWGRAVRIGAGASSRRINHSPLSNGRRVHPIYSSPSTTTSLDHPLDIPPHPPLIKPDGGEANAIGAGRIDT